MTRTIAASALPLFAAAALAAAPRPEQAPPPRVIPIAELVKQLGSEVFAEREAATKRLSSLPLDPPSELLAATKSENPEVRGRAVKAVQAMHANVAITRMPRGEQFAQQGMVDLFVAATAVWKLKPDDPRLWEPAQDLGRRLIGKAEMTGDRKPQDCPSSFKHFETYLRACEPKFTRMDVTYFRMDPQKETPPVLFRNEAIHSRGVVDPAGIFNSIIMSRGDVLTHRGIQHSVVFVNGDVTAVTAMNSVVIVCDGDVHLTDECIHRSLIVSRGNITAKRGASSSVLMAGGKVTLGEKRITARGRYNVIKEHETKPLGYITFFELSTVGVEAKLAGKAVQITAVAADKPFAAAGVKIGDIVVEVNGKKPDSPEALRRLLRDALAIGDAAVKLKRGDRIVAAKVALPE